MGIMIGAGITLLYTANDMRKSRNKVKEAHQAFNELLEVSQEQLREYWVFLLKFEEYRARFDPIDTSRDGNIITIERKPK